MTRRPRTPAAALDESALYEYAVKALGRRMRSAQELERLMRPKVEGDETGKQKIAAVVARLKDNRYLDDTAFALAYTRLRRENEGFGRRRVEREIARKGIAPDLIARTLDVVYESTDEEALARKYLARKRLAKPGSPAETARVIRRLITAGFSFATVTKILKNWNIDLSEEDLISPEEGD